MALGAGRLCRNSLTEAVEGAAGAEAEGAGGADGKIDGSDGAGASNLGVSTTGSVTGL